MRLRLEYGGVLIKKRIGIGLALSAFVALAAVLAVWDLRLRDDGPQEAAQSKEATKGSDGRTVALGIKGTVEYTVRDAEGNVKEHGVIHNTINGEGLNEIYNRITSAASGGAFDAIVALSVDVITDDPSDGVAGTSITDDLDGDSGIAGDQNQADGTVTTDFGTETGNGTVAVTFTAQLNAVSVKQVVLTKAAVDDTSQGPNPTVVDADILAYQDVPDVTLNTNDTVQYTWTLDVD